MNKIQKENFKNKINDLENNECIIITDFNENFKIGGEPIELSQIFYNKSQITDLGFCIIAKKKIKRNYNNYLLNIVNHNSKFVKISIDKFISKYLCNYKKLHFVTDNAAHFRSTELLKYILVDINKKVIETTMNFFVNFHGKTDLDGHYGLLQKTFDFNKKRRKSLQ